MKYLIAALLLIVACASQQAVVRTPDVETIVQLPAPPERAISPARVIHLVSARGRTVFVFSCPDDRSFGHWTEALGESLALLRSKRRAQRAPEKSLGALPCFAREVRTSQASTSTC